MKTKMSPSQELACALDPCFFASQVGIELDPWQAKLARSTHRRILVNASRQSGKSTTSAVPIALWTALYQPGSLVLMVSPSLRQSGELFKKSLDAYRALGRPVPSEVENRLSLELENGSRIVSLPGSESTIRGLSGASLILVDEASRVSDELLAAVRPMLATSGGRLIALSTPNGRVGWWYKAWAQEENWERYEIPASMCPRISPEFLAEERAALGAVAYAREYECSFDTPEGALWKPEWIDDHRLVYCPQLVRVAVAIDPSVTSTAGSDEAGIIAGGIDDSTPPHAYILEDKSMIGSPDTWMRAGIAAYYVYRCDRLIGEKNNGGDLIETLLRQIDPNVSYAGVWASHGKVTRAEPVSALYEQGRIHHVGMFAHLEKELTTWIPGGRSPNRLDALVWLLHHLILESGGEAYAFTSLDKPIASPFAPKAYEPEEGEMEDEQQEQLMRRQEQNARTLQQLSRIRRW